MTETDAELQLRVWKDLAVSKQILMRAATDALKLDPNCTQEELKVALEAAIKRAAEADGVAAKAQDEAKSAVAAVEKKLAESNKALATTQAALTEALAAQERLQQTSADERNNNALQVKKLKESLAEKDRAIKAISTALSDTPENVVKKLKTLKKQKMDEADARKKAEDSAAALRKEKAKLEQELKELKEAQAKAEQEKSSQEEAA